MTLMHNNEMLAGCVPKEPPETSWTNIGDGIYLRLVGTNMVGIPQVTTHQQRQTRNTHSLVRFLQSTNRVWINSEW